MPLLGAGGAIARRPRTVPPSVADENAAVVAVEESGENVAEEGDEDEDEDEEVRRFVAALEAAADLLLSTGAKICVLRPPPPRGAGNTAPAAVAVGKTPLAVLLARAPAPAPLPAFLARPPAALRIMAAEAVLEDAPAGMWYRHR